MEISEFSRRNAGGRIRGRMQRHPWADPHVSGASSETARRSPYPQREDGLPCHGADRA